MALRYDVGLTCQKKNGKEMIHNHLRKKTEISREKTKYFYSKAKGFTKRGAAF